MSSSRALRYKAIGNNRAHTLVQNVSSRGAPAICTYDLTIPRIESNYDRATARLKLATDEAPGRLEPPPQ